MTTGGQTTETPKPKRPEPKGSKGNPGPSFGSELGAVRRAAVLREAGPRARVSALRVRRVLDGMGVESVELVHLVEPRVPDALALAGGLSAVGPLDLIVALTPEVEVDAARVAVQAGAALARLRHAHPTATLRRVLGAGQVSNYTTLCVEVEDQEHLAVDHVVVQSKQDCLAVEIDARSLPSGDVVQVVASNPLAGLPRSPTTLDPHAAGSVTVSQADHSQGFALGVAEELRCQSAEESDVRVDGREVPGGERVRVRAGSAELHLVVVAEGGRPRSSLPLNPHEQVYGSRKGSFRARRRT